jgi:cation/acetate symporter
MAADRAAAQKKVADLKAASAPLRRRCRPPRRPWPRCPQTEDAAKKAWTPLPRAAADGPGTGPLAGMPRHAQQFAGDPDGTDGRADGLRRRRAATSWAWCSA